MICRFCKKNNPSNAKVCMYCGRPIYKENKKKNNKDKNIDIAIISGIAVLLAALVLLIVVYIASNVNHLPGRVKVGGGGGGGGGGAGGGISIIRPTQVPMPQATLAPTQEPAPPTMGPSENPGNNTPIQNRKDEFYDSAETIQKYADDYLKSVSNQSDLNTATSVIYEMWDKLLNEVYDYLEVWLDDEEFAKLEEDELEWIKEKEAAVKNVGEQWGDGTGRISAENNVKIEYTRDRCYYLISLIK